MCNAERNKIVIFHEKSLSAGKIAKKCGFNKSTVSYIILKWKKSGTIANKYRSGRPKCTSEIFDRRIMKTALKTPFIHLKNLTSELNKEVSRPISETTVRRRLHTVNVKGKKACKKPLLTKKHMAKRLARAKERRKWTASDWSRILWTDESKFCYFGNSGIKFVWRRPKEQFLTKNLQPTIKHGGGKL